MPNATDFANEWTDIIIKDVGGDYLGTMACHVDEVLNDLMWEGISPTAIDALDIHSPGDNCIIYMGERGPIEFRSTMCEDELFAALHSLAVLVGLPE